MVNDNIVQDDIHDDRFHRVCEKVVAEMEHCHVPGAVLGILEADKITVAPFGITSVENPLPVNEDTLFQIGSITKTYLATAIMRLVEMGKLDLEAPIRTYLPELKLADESVARRVTLRHLLTHTGGWVGDYFNDFGMGEDALVQMVARMAELEQLTPLGEMWSYSNSGFYIAGRVIEVVTGNSFETAIQQLVFGPLGLDMSFFFPQDVMTYRFAVGHNIENGQPKVARPWAIGRAGHPAGGIICTVRDVLTYACFHMGDGTAPNGTRLLSPESLAQMQTPLFATTGIGMIGLSWMIIPLDGNKIIGHTGGTNGQAALLRMIPAKKLAFAVFTNSDEGGMLCSEVANTALQQYAGISIPEAVPMEIPAEKLLPYVGRYDAAADTCEFVLRDGGLVLLITNKGGFPTPDSPPTENPPPLRAGVYAEDRFIILDDPLKGLRGEFLRDPDGGIAWLRLFSRVHARMK